MYFRAKQIGLVRDGVLLLPLNQTQIGETLGMTLVSVNRNLKRLRDYSAADFKAGKLIVKDWEKLSSIGEFDPTYLHQTVQLKR
jgi:CRP-like cAMP-binding protein